MKLPVKNIKGQAQGELEVKLQLVEDGKGTQAVHDTVVAYQAAQRMGTACTKNVGEVAGTNKKPWRQKGTGRARAGSFQSPLWRGGGVVFGPRPRDFTKKISRSTRQLALRKALSERLKAGDVHIIDDLKLSGGKTKEFVGVLKALEIEGTVLVVAQGLDKNLMQASRNIRHVEVTTGESLNTYQLLRSDKAVFTRGAFEHLEQRLTKE
ncbi:MAG TPA: 50S ribosomal protein L4 [Verrucomicrobiae bacterium]|jgi:large subunit ribosomal protein L4|nr:50S ribosomal protein L4 [Verrucomicrobiae bacterium]